MELDEFLGLIRRKAQTILTIVFVFLIVSVILSLVQPLKYSAASKLLVVQSYSAGADPYNFSRSNEYLSGILSNVIMSNSFFNKVIESGFQIDRAYFGNTVKKQNKEWKKTVSPRTVNDTGIIEVSVYHPDKRQAEQIALAVNYIIKTQHQFYHGGGSDIIIKTIDDPVISNWPVKPNIPFNLMLALVLGLVTGLTYIYLLPEERYSLNVLPRGRRPKKRKQVMPEEDEVEYEPVRKERVSEYVRDEDREAVKPREAQPQPKAEEPRPAHESKKVEFNGDIRNLMGE